MKKTTYILLSLTLIFTLILSGCGVKPDVNAKAFLDALKAQDMSKASSFMKKDGSKGEFKYDSPEQEKMIKAVFSKIDYKLDESTVKGDNATIKAKITSIDLMRVSNKMISELMPTLMAQALSGDKPDEKKQNEMMLQYMVNSINDPNAPKTQTDVTLELVKDGNQWLVKPTDDLLNALTGNYDKMANSWGNKK
ncbi:DUF4878 domain-containing protein [Clostridium manihotivorum]|uniref:DUF4878 domain-containing protein n=1 Tax=Clostridium manihotivorum TaxID=2320868 RepID=A0A410DN75_9CLOT|nr:DUF4878 domain-containing protein [Clostridium manihotivorum]QAA30542.1 DUF4878 domain-containing protein [Clostridium manihotivorum]